MTYDSSFDFRTSIYDYEYPAVFNLRVSTSIYE